jgi:hypothetical protein
LFDTEQSNYDVSIVANRVLQLAGFYSAPDNFEVISARALSPQHRLFILEKYIYATDDIGILVIDGIRDLVMDINSPSEATMITTQLLRWTQERNIHIMVVLHQNKDNNNARGHLGTEIVNKAESVVSVEKNDIVSIVRPEFCRGRDFTAFAFTIKNNLPEIVTDWKEPSSQEKSKKITYSTYPKETHLAVLSRVFSQEKKYTYNKLVLAVKAEFEGISGKFGRNKAVDFVTMYKANKFISHGKDEELKYQVYTLTQPV